MSQYLQLAYGFQRRIAPLIGIEVLEHLNVEHFWFNGSN